MSATGPDPSLNAAIPASAPIAAASAAGAGPHAEPDDREEIYFEGSPPVRSLSGMVSLFSLISMLMLAGAVFLILKYHGMWWLKLAMIVIALILTFIPLLIARSIRYRVSNYRIDFERGLLAKNIDTIELWHVEDLHFHQSLLDRILNVGMITVLAHDDTLPRLELRGVPNPRPLYETLKQRVIAVKRQRGVIKMDPE